MRNFEFLDLGVVESLLFSTQNLFDEAFGWETSYSYCTPCMVGVAAACALKASSRYLLWSGACFSSLNDWLKRSLHVLVSFHHMIILDLCSSELPGVLPFLRILIFWGVYLTQTTQDTLPFNSSINPKTPKPQNPKTHLTPIQLLPLIEHEWRLGSH